MRGRTCLALVALTGVPRHPQRQRLRRQQPPPDMGPTVLTPLLAGVVVAPMQSDFTPRDESAVSPLVLDVMTYAGR